MTERVTLLTDDERGVCRVLAEELAKRGDVVACVRLGEQTREIEPGRYTANLVSPESTAEIVELVRQRQGPIGGILHLLPLRSQPRFEEMDFAAWRRRLEVETKSLFSLVKQLSVVVEGAAAAKPRRIMAATGMGGTFGMGERPETNGFFPGQGGIYGFLKTLAREFPDDQVKAVDLNPQESVEALAAHLLAELTHGDSELEVGYDGSRRVTLQPRLAPVDQDAPMPLTLDDSWVVLVTGGARGITAEVATELAQLYRPTLLLVGRSPMPAPEESPETAGLTAPKVLKSALMEQMRAAGETVTPARVEERYARVSRDREIRTNMATMRQAGARVHYFQVDVRDEHAFSKLIEEVYDEFGRLDGVVHGAGVIEDKLIKDKSADSFDRVFDTKVDSAFVLSRKLQPASLKFLVFFASVSGRFGNRGQADYAAANEVLNKLAVYLDRSWPGRVVSLNWGPWATTGMVSAEVLKQFALRGVQLIPPSVGRRRLNEELRYGRKGEVEVIIGGVDFDAAFARERASAPDCPLIGPGQPSSRASDGSIEIIRNLDPAHDLYLLDHQIDGQPVLPMAAALELMVELAARGWPELQVAAVRGLRLLQGLVLQGSGSSAAIRVAARPQQAASQEALNVDAEISGVRDAKPVHYRATIEMARRLPAPPSVSLPPLTEARPYPIPVDEAYRRFAFHGPLFQKVTVIGRTGLNGIEGTLEPSSPGEWLAGAPEGHWLIDPAVFDCGLQFLLLWVREYWDMMALPSRFATYRRFGPPPATQIRCEVRFRPEQRHQIVHADVFFLGADGRVFGILEDMEAACSKQLDRVVGRARMGSAP